LVELSGDLATSLSALGLSERQGDEVARNAVLRSSPTMPALSRYTGVLYDALDVPGMTKTEVRRAAGRLCVASALFGLVRGSDPVPAYRLSAASSLPSVGPLGALWRPCLEPLLAEVDELVVDMRSGPYAGLAKVPSAVGVRVVSEGRVAISHFNKAHKGRLARALGTVSREPSGVKGLIRVAERAGLRLEQAGPRVLELVVS
jgi:cytoplasmic iron level regulating protein YaaA (DUF328/UPF0246 family)